MMNFQQTDALGGLLTGIQARQTEEQNLLNQQKTMQDLARMSMEQSLMAQKAPLELEGMRLGNLQKQGAMDLQNQQMEESKQRVSRENAQRYVQDMIQMGGEFPGAEDVLAERYGVKGHPVQEAFRQAHKRGQQAAMMSDQVDPMMYARQLAERIALSDDKSRQATATAEANLKKQGQMDNARMDRLRLEEQGKDRRAILAAQAKEAVQRLRMAADQFKNTSLNQYAARLLMEAEDAQRSGNEQLMLEKRQQANDVLLSLQAIAAAPGNAQRADEAQKLFVLTRGRVDLRGQMGAQPGAGPTVPARNPAAPQPTATPTSTNPGGVVLDPNLPIDQIKQDPAAGASGRTEVLAQEYAKPGADKAAIVREFKAIVSQLPKGKKIKIIGLDGQPYEVQ